MPNAEKKSGHFWGLFLWWQVEPEELEIQKKEYHTLGVWKSARKLSAVLLLFSTIVTAGVYFLGAASPYLIVDIVLLGALSAFVADGKRNAIVLAMVYWTFAKAQAALGGANPVVQIIWWALYMKSLYLAYQVEKSLSKNDNPTELPIENDKAS